MPVDLKNVKVGIIPAAIGLFTILSAAAGFAVWANEVESDVDSRADKQDKKIERLLVAAQTNTENIKTLREALDAVIEKQAATSEAIVAISTELKVREAIRSRESN